MPKAFYTAGVWEHFTVKDGLPDMKIECVFEDSRGRLWVGTHDCGVVCREGGEFSSFSCRDGLAGDGVFSILEDREGKLWLATNRGLTVYDGVRFEPLSLSEPRSFLWGSCVDLQGRLWFGMERQPGRPPMVARWDGHRLEELEISAEAEEQGQSIHQVICDEGGAIWLGGEGLYRYIEGEGFEALTQNINVTSNLLVVSSLLVRGKDLWVATDSGGIWIYSEGRASALNLQKCPTALLHTVSIVQDFHQGLWVITYDGVMVYYDGEAFHLSCELNTTVRAGLCLDRAGRLWVGTYGLGLYCYDLSRMRVFQSEHGLPSDAILCLAEKQESGMLWIGTRRGLAELSERKGSHFEFSPVEGAAEISQLLKDTSQRLWIATNRGQLLIRGSSTDLLFSAVPRLKRYRIHSLAEDAEGRIWFGLRFGKGFGYCEGSETVYFPPKKDAGYPTWIGAIEVDRHGRVWLGSASSTQWTGRRTKSRSRRSNTAPSLSSR